MLLGKNFDEIDISIIEALIEAGAPESVHLDFKMQSYGRSDADKKELLKDVSSFANCLGGHLVIGIEEHEGSATKLSPITGVDVDAELQRLESIVRTGVEPAIVGLRMKRIDHQRGSIIVMQIPRSHNPPHRVILKNSNRYYSRNSAGTYELSIEELRMLFGERRSTEERARAFVNERFLKIQANDGVIPLPADESVFVMHLVPLPDFASGRRIEISSLHEVGSSFCPIGAMGWSKRVNLEGYCVYRGGNPCHGYTQIFRDGSVEATSASLIKPHNGARYIPSLSLIEKLLPTLNSYIRACRKLDVSPPFLLQMSFVGTNGVKLGVWHRQLYEDELVAYKRNVLHLPSSIVTDYREIGGYDDVLAEQMHFLWNAFNFESCPHFDENGKLVKI